LLFDRLLNFTDGLRKLFARSFHLPLKIILGWVFTLHIVLNYYSSSLCHHPLIAV
jgi:hypothetical protein